MPTTKKARPLSVKQVADMFGVSTSAVRSWVAAGKLPSFRTPGGQRRFMPDDVAALLPDGGDESEAAAL